MIRKSTTSIHFWGKTTCAVAILLLRTLSICHSEEDKDTLTRTYYESTLVAFQIQLWGIQLWGGKGSPDSFFPSKKVDHWTKPCVPTRRWNGGWCYVQCTVSRLSPRLATRGLGGGTMGICNLTYGYVTAGYGYGLVGKRNKTMGSRSEQLSKLSNFQAHFQQMMIGYIRRWSK